MPEAEPNEILIDESDMNKLKIISVNKIESEIMYGEAYKLLLFIIICYLLISNLILVLISLNFKF